MEKQQARGTESLASVRPELIKQWHPTLNGNLTPDGVPPLSSKKAWWLGECGHEWEARVSQRNGKNSGCPVCTGRKVLAGFNDLETLNPLLASRWHPTKNGKLKPTDVSPKDRRQKVWWLCAKGHEWETVVYAKLKSGVDGCAVCTGRSVMIGVNDMATLFPQVASEWHPTKNNNKLPSDFSAYSNQKAWWLCSDGHEWETAIATRTSMKTGCPYCSGRCVILGKTDLSTTHPELVKQWHPTKNKVMPHEVSFGSEVRIHWICDKLHEWQTSVNNRARLGSGCPVCSNQKLLVGFNDLATCFTEVASQWHPTKNGKLKPTDVLKGSNNFAWWVGNCGHEHKARIADKISRSLDICPVCSNNIVLAGFNDLEIKRPDIASQWHPTKNGTMYPNSVTSSSGKKAWWLCDKGHEWEATIGNRTSGRGCPSCAKKGGFSAAEAGIFYLIYNNKLNAYKIGITNTTSNRLQTFIKKDWQDIYTVTSESGHHIRKLENAIKYWVRNEQRLKAAVTKKQMGKMHGWTETFAAEDLTNEEIIQKINSEWLTLISEP